MFQESFISSGKSLRARVLAFPMSLAVHAGVILGLIIVPLVRNADLPRLDVITALLVPPPPAPALPAAGRKRPQGRASRIQPVSARLFAGGGRLMAPVEIPDEISEEALVGSSGWSDLDGVENGPTGMPVDDYIGRIIGAAADDDDARNSGPVAAVVRPPRLVKRVDPVYPEIARQARVFGAVKLEATTNVYGRVRDVRVVESIPLLDQAALDAVRQWIYEPMVINGRPLCLTFKVTVRFVLS